MYYAAISPQEKLLASSQIFAAEISIWDIETGEITKVLPGHDKPTLGATFSPDGSKLASRSSANEVCVWEIESPKRRLR